MQDFYHQQYTLESAYTMKLHGAFWQALPECLQGSPLRDWPDWLLATKFHEPSSRKGQLNQQRLQSIEGPCTPV